ncbi:MAG: hypothetical protein DRP96_03995, partial [Candidatus Neomarinimicrobiota bacterium]
MNKTKLSINVITFCLIFLGLQNPLLAAKSREKLRLIGADRLEQITRNDVIVKKLTGNVHFRKGAVDLRCDLAYWFEKDERADFYHNVYVTKEDRVLQADTLVYYAADEIIEAHGNTNYDDGQVNLRARKIKYYVDEDISEAFGNVRLKDEKRSVRADYLVYYSA